MKGRKIFGGLVPYGEMWRTGANANTKITFSDAINFNGTAVTPGTYALYTRPGKDQWEVVLYKNADNWGLPREWDDDMVAAKTMVKPTMLAESQESFTVAINHLKMDMAHLEIMWDKTKVAIPFTVPTKDKTMASIDRAMSGPSANDYYSAAAFYLEADEDMEKAHEWISKAVEMRPNAFWMQTRKSLIEEKMGNKKMAIESAKKAKEMAEQAGNKDYVKINNDNLKKWGAM
jgi:tetratricopeptide (TPR) repeat protein